jgi:hypothetical protein
MDNTKLVEDICDRVLREYFNQREREKERAGENCIEKRFRIFTSYQKLLG